jgi:hypothetical protein
VGREKVVNLDQIFAAKSRNFFLSFSVAVPA